MTDERQKLQGTVHWVCDPDGYEEPVDRAILRNKGNEITLATTYEGERYDVILRSSDGVDWRGDHRIGREPTGSCCRGDP